MNRTQFQVRSSNYGDSFASYIDPFNVAESEYKVSCLSKSNDLDATQIYIFSKKLFKFDCSICGHQFELSPYDIDKGKWCQYCDGKIRCLKKECSFCPKTTMALIENINEIWSDKNKLKPSDVLMNSKEHIWIVCKICNHSYQTTSFNYNNKENPCVYCNGSYVLQLCSYDKNCSFCYYKSFASSFLSKQWNYSANGGISPYDVRIFSKKVFGFHCEQCNETVYKPLYYLNHVTSILCDNCYNYSRKKLKYIPPLYSSQIMQYVAIEEYYDIMSLCAPEMNDQ